VRHPPANPLWVIPRAGETTLAVRYFNFIVESGHGQTSPRTPRTSLRHLEKDDCAGLLEIQILAV